MMSIAKNLIVKKKEKLKEKFADSKKMKENGESRRFKEQKKMTEIPGSVETLLFLFMIIIP